MTTTDDALREAERQVMNDKLYRDWLAGSEPKLTGEQTVEFQARYSADLPPPTNQRSKPMTDVLDSTRIASTRPADDALGVGWRNVRIIPDAGNANTLRITADNCPHICNVYGYSPDDARMKADAILSALRQPAPRADDALRAAAMRLADVADSVGWFGNTSVMDKAINEVRAALASEEPTGPVCTLCGLTLKGV